MSDLQGKLHAAKGQPTLLKIFSKTNDAALDLSDEQCRLLQSETSPITLPLRDAVRVKNFEDAAAEWGQKGDYSMAQQFQDEADALRPVVIAARNLHEFATKALKNAHVVLAAAKAENRYTLQGSLMAFIQSVEARLSAG